MSHTKKEIKKAMIDPSSVFDGPEQVENNPSLSTNEKMKILRSWESDADAKLRADSENMANMVEDENPAEMLKRVHKSEQRIEKVRH